MRAIIMAGGKGTRIAAMEASVPKPMVRLCGKPVLEYQLEWLKSQGIEEAVLVIGHLGHVIKEYFGSGSNISPVTGESFGMRLRYLEEREPLGTAGALYYLREELKEDFLLMNGDVMVDIDLRRFLDAHQRYGGLVTILTHPNSHPYDSGIVETDGNGMVTGWLSREDKRGWYQNRVNAGLHLMNPGIFDYAREMGLFREPKRVDLDRDILKLMIAGGRLFAYDSPEYVKDMGTPKRCRMVEKDIEQGRVQARNLSRPQKAVFLDRDGTINESRGYIRTPEELVLLPGAGDAIRRLNESGYLVIVVTNQPVIARGEVTEDELRVIHNRMETLLGNQGAYVDAIYYCPHHPDRGYPGERPELKKMCRCRKPEPGMLLKAAKDYHIELKASWMAGDGPADMEAGRAAGCRTAGVAGCHGDDMTCADLAEFVRRLCGTEQSV